MGRYRKITEHFLSQKSSEFKSVIHGQTIVRFIAVYRAIRRAMKTCGNPSLIVTLTLTSTTSAMTKAEHITDNVMCFFIEK